MRLRTLRVTAKATPLALRSSLQVLVLCALAAGTAIAGPKITIEDSIKTPFPTDSLTTIRPVLCSSFRGVRLQLVTNINCGPDLGGTGHTAINFTGSAGSAGDTWLTVFDETPGIADQTHSPVVSY